jgi:hypothetical protein
MTDTNLNLLNASGFAFQLAIEASVRARPGRLSWRVVGREHPWKAAEASGYADLILTCGNLYVVVECKRTREGQWMFLMPDPDQMSRSHAKVAWIDTKPHRKALAGWDDIQVYPQSPESDFCAIRGQGEDGRPMLERVAGQVVAAADGLCADLMELHERSARSKVVLPVVVTNASLVVGQFDPASVDLSTAQVTSATFTSVGHIRFRKTLGTAAAPLPYEAEELRDLSEGAVRTVFVVHSSAFTSWLDQIAISPNDGTGPWDSARSFADAAGS